MLSLGRAGFRNGKQVATFCPDGDGMFLSRRGERLLIPPESRQRLPSLISAVLMGKKAQNADSTDTGGPSARVDLKKKGKCGWNGC